MACNSTQMWVEVVKVEGTNLWEGRDSCCGIHKCRSNICSIDRLLRLMMDLEKPVPLTTPASGYR
jgi:hypothetical protein